MRFKLRDLIKARLFLEATEKKTSDDKTDTGGEEREFSIKESRFPYKERDIHPWLVHFAQFGMGGLLVKTIFHEKSQKKKFSEWLHPDLVGFSFPFGECDDDLLEIVGGPEVARFFSFEMKREITSANFLECYYQAVANSTWANEGYLVAPNIEETEDLRQEMSDLSQEHGIGIISLNLDEPHKSEILYPSKRREKINWRRANKLAQTNPDFKKFLADAKIDIKNGRIHHNEYDPRISSDGLAKIRSAWNSC